MNMNKMMFIPTCIDIICRSTAPTPAAHRAHPGCPAPQPLLPSVPAAPDECPMFTKDGNFKDRGPWFRWKDWSTISGQTFLVKVDCFGWLHLCCLFVLVASTQLLVKVPMLVILEDLTHTRKCYPHIVMSYLHIVAGLISPNILLVPLIVV